MSLINSFTVLLILCIYIQVTSCIVQAGTKQGTLLYFSMFELLCHGLALRFSLYWEEGNSFGDIGIDSCGVSSFPICAGLSARSSSREPYES